MSHVFDDYGPIKQGEVGERRSGVIISQDDGEAVAPMRSGKFRSAAASSSTPATSFTKG